jgi:hypothetical protein
MPGSDRAFLAENDDRSAHRVHSAHRAFAAGVVLVLLATTAACGQSGATAGASGPAGNGTGTTSTQALASSPSTTSGGTTMPGTSARQRSVADQLAGFFAAATRADGQLRSAAALVNGGIGTEKVTMSGGAIAAVEAVDTGPVVRALPGGLPPALQRSVLQVYGGLASRVAALRRVRQFSGPTLPRTDPRVRELMDCLSNGAAPAKSFAGDLAATRVLATATPAVTLDAASSRRTGELAIRASEIALGNRGCNACGGYAPRPVVLKPIVWKTIVQSPDIVWDGAIDGMQFAARYVAGRGWDVHFNAC